MLVTSIFPTTFSDSIFLRTAQTWGNLINPLPNDKILDQGLYSPNRSQEHSWSFSSTFVNLNATQLLIG